MTALSYKTRGGHVLSAGGGAKAIHAAFSAIHAGFVPFFVKMWYASLKAYPPP